MKAIVTGSFDPITIGHVEIIKKISPNYEKIYVVALLNDKKEYMFTLDEKKELIERSTSFIPNAIADCYDGLTCDYMHKNGISTIIRGVRGSQDLEYEKNLAQKMKELDPSFVTVFVESEEPYKHISSSLVRDKIRNRESISGLVHPNIEERILEIYSQKINNK